MSAAEDLRSLLEGEVGGNSPGKAGTTTREEDLSSLLSELREMDVLRTPPKSRETDESMSVQKQIENRQQLRLQQRQLEQAAQPPPPPEQAAAGSVKGGLRGDLINTYTGTGSETQKNTKFSSGKSFQRHNLMEEPDAMDSTVLSFHSDVSLRTKLGRYFTAMPTSGDGDESKRRESGLASSSSGGSGTAPFVLGVEGQGVGDPLDCLNFLSLDSPGRDYRGPLRYGMTVAIKVSAAKDRFLGIRSAGAAKVLGTSAPGALSSPQEETRPGFWRALPGSGERWTILKGRRGRGGVEEPKSRGKYVRQGDTILLLAGAAVTEAPSSSTPGFDQITSDLSSDDPQKRLVAGLASITLPTHLVSLHEGIDGAEARLVHRDRTGLGGELFQIDYYGSQPTPYWASRPYLCHTFLGQQQQQRAPLIGKDVESPGSNPAADLDSLDSVVQQACVVREALLALSGVQGGLIKVHSARDTTSSSSSSVVDSATAKRELRFSVDVDVCSDRSLTAQVEQMLPVCEHAMVVRDFIRVHSRQSYGLVSHALASSIKLIFREFDVLVAQLEYQLKMGKLSMQRLVYLIQPSSRVLKLLALLASRVWDQRGGELLDTLHDVLMEQGEAKAKQLLLHLFSKAIEPFLGMIRRWIFAGELHDNYAEFMIKVDRSLSRDALSDDFNAQYWESRYTLNGKYTPKILRNVAHRILTAGKYLNVVKGCIENGLNRKTFVTPDGESRDGGIVDLELPPQQDLVLDSEGSVNGLTSIVEAAYRYSSKALLRLLEEGHGMSSHLNSLSRFFLLEHGDFFVQFMDTAGVELRRDVKDIAVHRIQTLLQSALASSTLYNDPHKDALSCTLARTNLIQHLHMIQTAGTDESMDTASVLGGSSFAMGASQGLKGVEALTLDYAVAWPMNLVLSRRAVIKYQLLSRLLFFSKHVETRVLSTWSDHQSTKELDVRESMGPAFSLRHRMLHFLHNFVYYISLEVISPRGHEMKEGLAEAVDMDEVLGLHERFLDTCLKECLLASQSLLVNLTKIMTTCLLFADNMKVFAEQSSVTSKKGVLHTLAASKNDSTAGATAVKTVTSFSTVVGGKTVEVVEYRDVGAARRARLNTQSIYVKRESEHEGFHKMIQKFEVTFDTQLNEFMESLWQDSFRQHPQLANLCTRLDYNGFYSSRGDANGSRRSSREM